MLPGGPEAGDQGVEATQVYFDNLFEYLGAIRVLETRDGLPPTLVMAEAYLDGLNERDRALLRSRARAYVRTEGTNVSDEIRKRWPNY
jgi:hypothetical protein